MANILDVFSTHTGERLLRRSVAIANINKDKLHNAYIFALPMILATLKSKDSFLRIDAQDLMHFIDEGDILTAGEKVNGNTYTQEQLEAISKSCQILGLSNENSVQVFNISAGFLTVLIQEIQKRNTDIQYIDILKNLTGEESNLEKIFIEVLVKNSDSPGFIDSAEEIALKSKKDGNDDSILGGYTGGR
ncbi:MAG: hypothetical protein KJP01_05280 [Gramella sp.]|nr:hypothetical protein [Christiangramia sp.]